MTVLRIPRRAQDPPCVDERVEPSHVFGREHLEREPIIRALPRWRRYSSIRSGTEASRRLPGRWNPTACPVSASSRW